MTAPPSFTCPRCGRTSYHPVDVSEGYCGACHDWTDDSGSMTDMSTELPPNEAAPLIGYNPALLTALVDGGAGWKFFRTDSGVEVRASDGTLVGFQELAPSGHRVGTYTVYVNEREDV